MSIQNTKKRVTRIYTYVHILNHCTHTPTRMHAHTRMHARTHARTRAHTHTHTNTHMHTHTHTHTHTPITTNNNMITTLISFPFTTLRAENAVSAKLTIANKSSITKYTPITGVNEVRASQLPQASERVGSLIPASPRQGFQPCCEAGIREPTLSDHRCKLSPTDSLCSHRVSPTRNPSKNHTTDT